MSSSFKWDARKFKVEVDNTIHQKIEKACFMVESDAKRFVAVDTGRLRSSITHEITESKDEVRGVVGTNVDYAIPQEYGSSKMSAHPYLRPALAKNIPAIKQLFRRKI